MRHRNLKPDKIIESLDASYFYPEMDSNDYVSNILPVKTELLSSPQPHRNRDGLIEIPEIDDASSHPAMNLEGGDLSGYMGKMTSPKIMRQTNRRTKRFRSDDDDSSPYEESNGGLIKQSKNTLVPKDDDYHFLISMHPYMNQLKSDQKLKVRMKMQKLIFRELYGDIDKKDLENENNEKNEKKD